MLTYEIEKRVYPRTSVTLECRVRSCGQNGRWASVSTLNISKRGVLTIWEHASLLPRIGQNMIVEVPLPGHPAFGTRCLRFVAAVQRVQRLEKCIYLVALHASKTGIRQLKEAPEPAWATATVQ